MNHKTESLNVMNVATVFEEKIVLFIASAKNSQCRGGGGGHIAIQLLWATVQLLVTRF